MGREFSPVLLKKVWKGSDSLDSLLVELKRLEFLYERTGAEEPIYVFKHNLTQEVAYESLLTTRRQALHAAAGQALESLHGDRLEDAYDRLAYHYARTDNAAKAVEYLTLVAEKAARGYAHAEAVTILHEALKHAEQLPGEARDRCVLNLVIRQARSLFLLGRRQELVQMLLGHQDRVERLREPSLLGRYYLGLGTTYSFLGEREQAMQSLQRALDEGRRHGDRAIQGMAHTRLALEYGFAGDRQQQVTHARQGIALLEGTEEHLWLGLSLYILGLSYLGSGDLQPALEIATRLHALGETVGDRRLQVQALTLSGQCYTRQGEWGSAIEALQHAFAMSPDDFETASVTGALGRAYLEKGDLALAVPTLEQAVEQADQYRSRHLQNSFRIYLGEAYGADSQIEQARDLTRQGLELAEVLENPSGIGLAQHALGRIAYTSGNLVEAEIHLQEALETFSSIQARYGLARTHLDLGSLAHTQDNQETATIHLSTAYAWFNKLQVPKWIEKAEQLAREYGVTLTEVELDEVTEGSS